MSLAKSSATLISCMCWLLVGLVSPSFAEPAEPVVTGGETQYRTKLLTSQIRWHKNIDQAKAEAQKNHKLIFWVQMLGDINEYT